MSSVTKTAIVSNLCNSIVVSIPCCCSLSTKPAGDQDDKWTTELVELDAYILDHNKESAITLFQHSPKMEESNIPSQLATGLSYRTQLLQCIGDHCPHFRRSM